MIPQRKIKALKTTLIVIGALFFIGIGTWLAVTRTNVIPAISSELSPGDIVDSMDGVYVYYNGAVGKTYGRNTSPDGYNIGLKYQCVEFVKRYYYEYYNHKMPDPWGHAKDFFDPTLKGGGYSERRDLIQYSNGGDSKPRKGDLIIFDGHTGNRYGHVAIVSEVSDTTVEIIQQNPGPRGRSRAEFALMNSDGKWHVGHDRILGWLSRSE